jgi:hypothetical protein
VTALPIREQCHDRHGTEPLQITKVRFSNQLQFGTASKGLCQIRRGAKPASLAGRQGAAEGSDLTSLVRQNAHEFKTVEKSHAMADHGA